MIFEKYHFHLYYPVAEIERATQVIATIKKEAKEKLELEIGRVWDKPVGPHPIGSCQITVPHKSFTAMAEWFMTNREDFDVFVHPVSGNDLDDHTKYISWIGREHKLNIEMFLKDKK